MKAPIRARLSKIAALGAVVSTALYACTVTTTTTDTNPSIDGGPGTTPDAAAANDSASDASGPGVDGSRDSGAPAPNCAAPPAAGPTGALASTTKGGLWNEASTWVGGKVPGAGDSVVIHGEVQVDVGAGDATVSCAAVTIAADGVLRAAAYAARTIAVRGDFVNFGAVRNGPSYASYDTATLEVHVGGRFFQQGDYGVVVTHFTGAADQELGLLDGKSLSGSFVDDNPGSALRACTPISVSSLQLALGTSSAARGTLDMGEHALTLAQGDLAITNGVLRASKIVGVAGATLNSDNIEAVGTLVLDGDVRTAASTIVGSVKVLASGVVYNVANATPTLAIHGNLENHGIVRRGPGYAAYGEGDLTIEITGDILQNGPYTPTKTNLVGATKQTISVGAGQVLSGTFSDTTPNTPIAAGTDLTIAGATFELGTGGTLDMGSHAITHTTGEFKVTGGTLVADSITGAEDENGPFNVPAIKPPSGTLSLQKQVRISAAVIEGSVKVLAGGVLYNVGYQSPTLVIHGNLENNGVVRRGPGYAAYGEGDLTVEITGDIVQNGPYTPTKTNLVGAAKQTISVGPSQVLSGTFVDITPSTPVAAGSDLVIGAATFDLGVGGTLDMGSYAIVHAAGEFKIAAGTLLANSITGADDGNGPFTIPTIQPPSGTLTVRKHYRTSTTTISGNLVVAAGAHVYNEYHVEAHLTATGTVTQSGTIGSGPGYASYDSGSMFLNGLKLPGW